MISGHVRRKCVFTRTTIEDRRENGAKVQREPGRHTLPSENESIPKRLIFKKSSETRKKTCFCNGLVRRDNETISSCVARRRDCSSQAVIDRLIAGTAAKQIVFGRPADEGRGLSTGFSLMGSGLDLQPV